MKKYKTFKLRLLAMLIDSLILLPFSLVENLLNTVASKTFFLVGMLLVSLCYSLYFVILHATLGQTVGKKVVGIKVVDISEQKLIGINRSFLRESPWILGDLLVFVIISFKIYTSTNNNFIAIKELYENYTYSIALGWLAIEITSMLLNSKRRAIHDIIANDVVIKSN